MFKKILASVGIGGAKVDTLLNTEMLCPGDIFEATIVIKGGGTEQDISGLDLALMTRVKVERDDTEMVVNKTLCQWHISDQFTLQADEVREIPFKGRLPLETPISANGARNNQTKVWIATGLNIDMALDASDKDPVNVIATSTQNKVLQGMDDCGYSLVKADVEDGMVRAQNFQSSLGCYQELEYRPNRFALFGLNEVEVTFVPTEHQTHILFELDRNFGGDSYRSLSLNNDVSQDDVTSQIKNILG
ncbi:sporulation protein [Oceanospirillum maris]|uniref:sporulation protein n=1 Tax=Oceanospirillum maris TaxID=64977 RepID=UPI00040BFEE8|nr:sporulation protein [Oceanospirillum maris]